MTRLTFAALAMAETFRSAAVRAGRKIGRKRYRDLTAPRYAWIDPETAVERIEPPKRE